MNIFKRSLALFMVLCMMIGMVPFNAFAAQTNENAETIATENEKTAEENAQAVATTADTTNDFMKVFHLDCGRKYFTVDQVKELIDAISEVGFSHMELAIGNDGLRLLLDDMSVTANGTTYDSDTIKSGIMSGNSKYSHSGEWTQSDMDTIIAYAATKGVEIIPLVNNPGHMDSILAAMSACGINGYYKYSARTVDLENSEAVAFTQALVMKYAKYFAGKGCKYFNIGADEYANDYHTADSTGMGFGYLIDNNMYGNFITYVNALVDDICELSMTPIAFNDGIYFRENVSFGTFDNRLMIAAWSGGWGGIKPASTTFLVNKGHQILNTNERWYYVLGRKQSVNSTYCYESALSNAKSESVTTVTDHTGATAIGAMQCVWCDDPSVNYETYKSNVMLLISTLAENNPTYFTGPNEPIVPDEPVPPEPETVTKTDEATNVAVTAAGLTSLTVKKVTAPVVENASAGKVVAWNMTPATVEGTYAGEAIVSVPVPTNWTNVRGGVMASNHGEAVMDIEGKLENGVFTFNVPHFSTVMAYDAVPTADNLEGLPAQYTGSVSTTTTEGESYWQLVTNGVDGIESGKKYLIASGNSGSVRLLSRTGGRSSSLTVSNNRISTAGIDYQFTLEGSGNSWTIKDSNGSYLYPNATRSYYWSYSLATEQSTATTVTINNTSSVTISRRVTSGTNNTIAYIRYNNGFSAYSSSSNLYLFEEVTTQGSTVYEVGLSGMNALLNAVPKEQKNYTDETWTVFQNAVTAANAAVSNTEDSYNNMNTANAQQTSINNAALALYNAWKALAEYNLITITINYVNEKNVTVKSEKINVREVATSVTLTSPVYDSADNCYVFEDTELELNLPGTTTYNVKVTYQEEDLTKVEPLEIEYWITNHPVQPNDQQYNSSDIDHEGEERDNAQRIWIEIPATDALHTENGMDLNALVAATGIDSHIASINVVLWKGVALDTEEHQQTTDANDNESFNGTDFTKIRYWQRKWQVFDGTSWIPVTNTTQLVAYYLQKTMVTNLDVIQTEVVDWGEIYGITTWNDSKFVALDFAIQYENETRNPNSFAVDEKTMLFHCDYNSALNQTVFRDSNGYYRRIGTIRATESASYEVYMITITPNDDDPGTEIASSSGRVNTINYNGTEKVVWVDDVANLGKFEAANLQHPDFHTGGEPVIEKIDIYNQQAALVTYYVRAKATPDSLTVHYIDEAAGNVQFYDYNIAVAQGTYFDERIALPNPWKGNLVNGTLQTIDPSVKQTVSSDLSTLPALAAQYLYSEYECVRIELKYTTIMNEDGSTSSVPKDLYLYYTFNPTVTFVADFGLPIEITATDLNEKLNGIVSDMKVTGGSYTAYGRLIDNGTSITYQPTKIMRGSDYFTILVNTTKDSGILDDASTQVAFRVYVVPATTVFYEESFFAYDGDWNGVDSETNNVSQTTEKLGSKVNVYGYDDAYDIAKFGSNSSSAYSKEIGAKASFTFTGTGFELYANSKSDSGYVFVYSQGKLNKLYTINTQLNIGDTDATNQQTGGTYYSLPIISEKELPYGTYTVEIRKVKDEQDIYIDGVRIINTIDESGLTDNTKSIYYADEEDKPDFYQLRDYVLNAIGVEGLTESDYIDSADRNVKVDAVRNMAGQVYDALGEGEKAVIITDNKEYSKEQIQDLLDNGPKNELYLYPEQTLAFSVKTARVMQLGMKSPIGNATFEISVTAKDKDQKPVEFTDEQIADLTLGKQQLGTTVDMFYKIADKVPSIVESDEYTYTVSINVTSGMLSITDLKICDDPNFTFTALTKDDIENVLLGIYGLDEAPELPEEPEVTYADAVLNVAINDTDGNALASTTLTANGVTGETATFAATDIQAAVEGVALPEKYKLSETTYADVEVVYGEETTINFTAEEIVEEKPETNGWNQIVNAVVNTINTVVNTIKNIFSSFFRW